MVYTVELTEIDADRNETPIRVACTKSVNQIDSVVREFLKNSNLHEIAGKHGMYAMYNTHCMNFYIKKAGQPNRSYPHNGNRFLTLGTD